MQRITNLLRAASEKFEERSLREKLLVLGATFVVLAFLWHQLVFQDQQQRVRRLESRIPSVKQEISSLQQKKGELLEQVGEDEQERLRRQMDKLRQEIAELDRELREKSSELISPRRMTEQLPSVLRKSSELELTHMANSPPRKVELANLIDSSRKLESDSLPDIYRHPLSLTFKGSYRQAIQALSRMRDLSSRFFWDRLEYTVVDHPRARLRLNVHTLSLDKAWIGF